MHDCRVMTMEQVGTIYASSETRLEQADFATASVMRRTFSGLKWRNIILCTTPVECAQCPYRMHVLNALVRYRKEVLNALVRYKLDVLSALLQYRLDVLYALLWYRMDVLNALVRYTMDVVGLRSA
ncbi:hypothetical protein NDU88_001413 [Pleurodeles waltl]|uniref:Uncharacterized protein n=1 Tax=Pleurodeles waltl TaxID=8319 RepID=A0AAV7V9I9_PLEWA|nr:hypothetical protein NDU88_001413 [Pleurodeles waltl]